MVIGREEKALIPAEVKNKKYKALIDTGASRSCMSERSFRELQLDSMDELSSIRVTSATGAPIEVMGITKCPITLGSEQYSHNFMICKNIRRPMILGIDFLRKYRIGTNWTKEGQFQIQTPSMEIVEAIEVYHKGPTVRIAKKMKIPSRTLVLLQGSVKLKKYHQHRFYEMNPNPEIEKEYPHLVMYPILHQANICGHMKVPICIINFGDEDVHLYPDKKLGTLQEEKIKLKDTQTNTSYESICEVDDGEETGFFSELAYDDKITEGKIITSPADINPRVKPKLKDADITPEWKQKFEELYEKYKKVFSKDSADIGKTPIIQMEIDTGDNPPVSQRPYSLALKHVDWVRQELEALEKAGVITRSVSPWASPIVIVPKKAAPGEPPKRRMCVDYRALNSLLPPVTKANSKAKGVLTLVPLPKIDEIYAALEGSVVYSTFDMRSGYYHIELTPASKEKSAFVVGGPYAGKYQWNRCPFGLTQAPAYFQRVVHEVIEGLTFAYGYLDDILVFSKSIEEHFQHCEIIFKRLKRFRLKLSYEKCAFLKSQVQYLGHLLSGAGIEPVPEKLQALREMIEPDCAKGVKIYLGFVGYYRKFIPKYSDIAKPLTELTKLDIPFVWTDQCQKAFELLKEYLLKEPILVYPDTSKPYTLYTDASKYAWAGVLTQKYIHMIEGKEKEIYHPVTYLSGLFRGSQLNWATLTKEAYAIFMCVKKLDYYLAGAQTTLRSDHLPLKKFLKQKTGNSKVNNWALSLEEYEITFEYIKGIKNTLADAMSRLVQIDPTTRLSPEPEGFEFGELKVDEDEMSEIELQNQDEQQSKGKLGRKGFEISVKEDDKEPIPEIQLTWNMPDKDIAKVQRQDEFCRKTIEEIQRRKRKTSDKYHMHNGLLHRFNLDYKQRFQALVIPVSYAKVVLKLAHDELGHNGTARTYALIKRMFYWKGLKKDTENYVKSCHICQQYNIQSVRYTSGHFEVPETPMDFISMDLIGEFKMGSTQGNRYALTVICMLTGYTWCIPIPDKSAETIVKSYIREVYSKYGGSRKILSDNGTEFKNKLFEQVAKDLGIEHKVYSPPYHPASNGRIEGFHSFLKACLAKHISNSLEWDELVHLACSVYNFFPMSIHERLRSFSCLEGIPVFH